MLIKSKVKHHISMTIIVCYLSLITNLFKQPFGKTEMMNIAFKNKVFTTIVIAFFTLILSACNDNSSTSNNALFTKPAPSVNISTVNPTTPVVDQSVAFVATGSGNGLTYAWSFGDGQTGTGASAKHNFSNVGSYKVAVVATDNTGLTATATAQVVVSNAPISASISSISPNSPQTGQLITLVASGSGQGALTYAWNFGDLTVGSGKSTTHSYNNAGNYALTLTVTDSAGQITTASNTIIITATPPIVTPVTAAITPPTTPIAGQDTTLIGTGTGQGSLSYAWNFGDGQTGTGASSSHTYSAAGIYSVSLIVTDSSGTTSSPATASITVNSPPAPSALTINPHASNAIVGTTLNYTGGASGGGGLTYSWDFGDGSAVVSGGASNNITHSYSSAGSYTVTLIVTDTFGQTATATATVVVSSVQTANLVLLAGSLGGTGNVDGTGAEASFYLPNAVAFDDSTGNTYVLDSGNGSIRKITSTGVVTTVGGTAARLFYPAGLAVDSNTGALYTTDSNTTSIIKITAAGVVTTFAGSDSNYMHYVDGIGEAAGFAYPSGLAFDSNTGHLYVADSGSNTIRKITSAGVVTTFAGTAGVSGSADGTGAAAQFNNPSGLAFDSNTGDLYVADNGNNIIRKISPTGVVTTFAGTAGVIGSADGTGTAAQFNNLGQPSFDSSTGNLYVADNGNNTVRKISPTGVVTTFAGTVKVSGSADGTGGAAQFDHPSGLAIDRHTGDLYVTEYNKGTIRKITAEMVVTTFAGRAGVSGSADGTGAAAQFISPAGLAFDSNTGHLYVADFNSNTIRKITSAGVVTTFAGTAGVSGFADGTGAAAQFNNPMGLAFDSNTGNLYVADYGSNTIRKITSAGVVTTFAGTAGISGSADGTGTSAQFNYPSGLVFDSNTGNLYVADNGNNIVRKITSAGVVTTFAGTAGVSGSANGTGATAQFNGPTGLAFDSNTGNLYVADLASNTIRKITPTGVVTTFAGTAGVCGSADGTGAAASFCYPYGLAFDTSTDSLYVTDNVFNLIRKISKDGVVTTAIGSSGKQGYQLSGSPTIILPPLAITMIGHGEIAFGATNNYILHDSGDISVKSSAILTASGL